VSEHDDPTEEHELYEEVPPRSIFAATWFRVLLVVIVIGVIGAVAIPYVLDFMNPPPSRPATASKPPSPPVAIPSTPHRVVARGGQAGCADGRSEPKSPPPAATLRRAEARRAESRFADGGGPGRQEQERDGGDGDDAAEADHAVRQAGAGGEAGPATKPDVASKPDHD
jgi:hypothetical protein